jgi:hypothetical protein
MSLLALGSIHRPVGLVQQGPCVRPVSREERNAEARRNLKLDLLDHEGFLEGSEHALTDLGEDRVDGRVGGQMGERRQRRKNRDELVAADPRHEVAFAQAFL